MLSVLLSYWQREYNSYFFLTNTSALDNNNNPTSKERTTVSVFHSGSKQENCQLSTKIHSPFVLGKMVFLLDYICYPHLQLSVGMRWSSCQWNMSARDVCRFQPRALGWAYLFHQLESTACSKQD